MNCFAFAVILLVAFLGSVVHGITGFGFSLVVMGFFTIFLPVRESTLVALALNTALCFSIVYRYRSRLVLKEICLILFGGLIGSGFGYFILVHYGGTQFLKKYLGLVMILMVLLIHQTNRHAVWSELLKRKWIILLTGVAGGLIGGVFAIGGPFFVIYFLTRFSDKREYNVNMQVAFIALNSFTIAINGFAGGLDRSFYLYVLTGLPLVFLGVYLGLRLFENLDRKLISQLAYGLIVLSGINLLVFS